MPTPLLKFQIAPYEWFVVRDPSPDWRWEDSRLFCLRCGKSLHLVFDSPPQAGGSIGCECIEDGDNRFVPLRAT
jgi:hypothetical protein